MDDRVKSPARGRAMVGAALILAIAFVVVLDVLALGRVALAQPKTPHAVEGRGDCLVCHDVGKVQPMPANHAGRPNATCLACHAPAAAPAAAPQAAPSVTATQPAPAATATPAPAAPNVVAGPTATPTPPPPTRTPAPMPTLMPSPRDNAGCLACHQGELLAVRLPSGEILKASVSPAEFAASIHGGNQIACVSCHTDKTTVPHRPVTAQDHARYTAERTQACATCHQQVTDSYWQSLHGRLVAAGRPDAPTCVACHGREANPHAIRDTHTKESPVWDRNQASQVCGKCHTKARETYEGTFHGKTMRLGKRTDAATCIDCHGAYGVQRVHSPERPVDNTKLAEACAQCHPGADGRFAAGWPGHEEPSPVWFPAAYFTERFLYFLTIAVVGFGIVHVELDLLRWVVSRVRGRRGRGGPSSESPEPSGPQDNRGQPGDNRGKEASDGAQ